LLLARPVSDGRPLATSSDAYKRGDPVPWPSNGDYYSFKEDVIKQRAPAASGVYGIYNFKHHILISHSNNIRESLLRHCRETNFRFRRLDPSGFTFEACPPEFREVLFRRLALEYQPILRPGESVGLAAWLRSWTAPGDRAFHPQISADEPEVEDRRPTTPMATDQDNADRENIRRDQFALAGSGFALFVALIALFVLLGENRNVTGIATRKLLSSAQYFTAFADRGAPTTTPAPQAAEATASRASSDMSTGAKTDPAPPELRKSAETTAVTADTRVFRSWTVQALATPDQSDALYWRDQLQAKGYDAFIVEVDIKGHRWHRVRVGALPNFREAEMLEKALQSQEGFLDAFVVHSTKADVALASTNP
jgi:cell division septation protein DedD